MRDLITRLLKGREERLTAFQAKKHFWFNKEESEDKGNILIQSANYSFLSKGKKKQENQDDIEMKRLSEKKDNKGLIELTLELRKWISTSETEGSTVFEI